MANLLDYLDWRGDLPFDRAPFNEVDNLIFACLSYIDFEGVVPAAPTAMPVTLAQAYKVLESSEKLCQVAPLLSLYPELLARAAATVRFRGVLLSHHKNAVDHIRANQFSATVFTYEKNKHYIAFRGTDDNLAGWKEDFLMGFKETVLAQAQAVRYVGAVVPLLRGSVILGGHSKGGNLAVFAAAKTTVRIRRRLETVYNNDGPGFLPSVIGSDGFKAVLGRIVTIIPQTSVVGMMLEHGCEYKIIGSTERLILSHNPLTWEVLGTSFVHKTELSRSSRQFNEALGSWLAGLTLEQREQFVEALFDIITASGAHTLSDLSKERLSVIDATIRKLRQMDKQTRTQLRNTIINFFTIRQRMLLESIGEGLEAFRPKKG
jgi:hypothetical protein